MRVIINGPFLAILKQETPIQTGAIDTCEYEENNRLIEEACCVELTGVRRPRNGTP
jgi:hypothetical protein